MSSNLFLFAVTSIFLPPLIHSKGSCHKSPNAFAVSHISLNHTFLVLPKWELKERVGEKHQNSGVKY